MRVKLIGNGVWGKALYSVIVQNNPDVSFATKAKKTSDQDVIVLSLPTRFIREALGFVSFPSKNPIIINTAKGIEKSTHLLPQQIVKSIFPDCEYYVLMGPSFAEEVSEKMPTLVNLGYEIESENNEIMKNIFQTNYFRVRLTNCIEALELSGAFKNIYAIACGLTEGMGYGMNTRVKILILAIEEMSRLQKNLNLKLDSSVTAGTIGDLILTGNSIESRNFKFGKLIADEKIEKAMEEVATTVEGYDSISSVEYFETKAKTKLPLASFIKEIVEIDDPKSVKKYFERFVSSA